MENLSKFSKSGMKLAVFGATGERGSTPPIESIGPGQSSDRVEQAGQIAIQKEAVFFISAPTLTRPAQVTEYADRHDRL